MIPFELSYKPIKLILKKPFVTAKRKIEYRLVFYIKLKNETGTYYGECAPFPDFSDETYVSAEDSLKKICTLSSIDEINKIKNELTPSVLFGIDNVLFNAGIINPFNGISGEILVNALAGTCDDSLPIRCIDFFEQGYTVIKIKTGVLPFEDELRILKKIPGEIKLRLDSNGMWSVEETLRYIEKMNTLNIEYIEQPVKFIKDLLTVAEMSYIPVAADESLRNLNDAELLLKNNKLDFLVLKPSLTGSFKDTLDIISRAKQADKKVIISTAVESSMGWNLLPYFAAETGHNFAHGLTKFEFENDMPDNFPDQ